jgi:osmotically-inducible protein OsmY
MKQLLLYLKLLIILAFACLIQSCMSAAISGVSTGAQAAYNQHNLKNSFRNQSICMKVDHAIHWQTTAYKDSRVSVSTFNNIVLLTGQVPDTALRNNLLVIAKSVPGVTKVYNLTTVSSPTSSLVQISDSWITTKIKSQMIAEEDIDPSQIKVLTENGTVYLIGTVFPNQGALATEIARSTSGVENVVRIFSYLHVNKSTEKIPDEIG